MGFIDINTFKHRTGTVKVWYRDIPYTVLSGMRYNKYYISIEKYTNSY